MTESILLHYESIDFSLENERLYIQWIEQLCNNHQLVPDTINYIFSNDEYVLKINKTYLDHDFYTDIITFPITLNPLSVDIYVSIDRVTENAKTYKNSFDQELKRVMSHGILHIAGFKDKTAEDIKQMRREEEKAILLFPS